MPDPAPIAISYFSDLLCIWAYAAQARLDEVRRRFPDQVSVSVRFCPIFGDTARRIGEGWRERGGYEGFNAHIRGVAGHFDHIAVHARVWLDARPASSAGAHLYVKAAQLVEARLGLEAEVCDGVAQSPSDRLAWALRLAFFRDGRDLAQREVQDEAARALGLPVAAIADEIANGRAYAALCADLEARDALHIEGSPTFVLNEGRQKLYGNVGYRVIEANIQELLREPEAGQASWC
jgi:predicted DsbA family dithiol-disulfide isomerase